MGKDRLNLLEYNRIKEIIHKREEAILTNHKERAWLGARAVADMIKNRYGALNVWLYGSLANNEFSLHSDIDLMVMGTKGSYWKMYLEAEKITSPIPVSIVCYEDAFPSLINLIKKEGLEL